MQLSAVKNALTQMEGVRFQLPNGEFVPAHFHVTEVGLINRKFIDCGGKYREETNINFQLWVAEDYDHRLIATKLSRIIDMAEEHLNLPDAEVEVEYQGETIGRYFLDVADNHFVLRTTQTACLAGAACGIPLPLSKAKTKLSELGKAAGCCTPESGCC